MQDNKLKEEERIKISKMLNDEMGMRDYFTVTEETKIIKIIVGYAQSYHRTRVEGITEEMIEEKFPKLYGYDGVYTDNTKNIRRQEGANWLKQTLLNND